jgi:hypothetical protein
VSGTGTPSRWTLESAEGVIATCGCSSNLSEARG